MSIQSTDAYNGKVVSNIIFTQPYPGGKKEYSVTIDFQDGSQIALKSESSIATETKIIDERFTGFINTYNPNLGKSSPS